MKFENKVCVITGGSQGIGKALVEEFINEGAFVAMIDLQANDTKCDLFFKGDISDCGMLSQFSEHVIKAFDKVDIIINNACVSNKGIVSGCGYEDFLHVQKVGVVAPYMLVKLLSKNLKSNASIINIASTRANMSQADTESYTAAKGGIVALTHALAVSLSGKARVNCISPGWINTKDEQFEQLDHSQHPVGRIGVPQDIVNMAMFLCSEESAFVTGQEFIVDGGMSKVMIYHNDAGWKYEGEKENEN